MYVSFVLSWLGICYFINSILPESIRNVMKKFSSNVTVIYVIQYILIIYVQVLICQETYFNAAIVIGFTVLYTVIAYFGAILYKKFLAKKEKNKAITE